MTVLEVSNVQKSFNQLAVLKGVSVKFNASELVSIVGSSGAGKSTLLHIIGSLMKPDSGTVHILNQEIYSLKDKALSAFRNKNLGFVFQFHHLLPEFSAIENVCIPALIGGMNEAEAQKKATELLDIVKLSHRLHHKPGMLSGGEQQRVAVARALINNPSVILADEPSGNLDSENATKLHELFVELKNSLKKTIVVVTHNDSLAKLSDRVIHMKDGMILNN